MSLYNEKRCADSHTPRKAAEEWRQKAWTNRTAAAQLLAEARDLEQKADRFDGFIPGASRHTVPGWAGVGRCDFGTPDLVRYERDSASRNDWGECDQSWPHVEPPLPDALCSLNPSVP